MLDEETVSETEMFESYSDQMMNVDESVVETAESTQPPTPDLFEPNAPHNNLWNFTS